MMLYDNDSWREDFMETVYEELSDDSTNSRANRIIFAYDAAPAVDAIPVVRCGECSRFMEYTPEHKLTVEGADGDCWYRVLNSIDYQFNAVTKRDYCSWGKAKD